MITLTLVDTNSFARYGEKKREFRHCDDLACMGDADTVKVNAIYLTKADAPHKVWQCGTIDEGLFCMAK